MIKFENTEVLGWEHAIRGMRNPLESWDKIDTVINEFGEGELGDNDLKLMRRLGKAGTDHRKFMRMITVYVDITAPLYWWKEFDTYKVGTVSNSCSTMHCIHKKEFTLNDFSCEHLIGNWVGDNNDSVYYADRNECEMTSVLFATPKDGMELIVNLLNVNRKAYLETKDKKYWWQMIQLLPSSYNQKRTIMLNYEVLANMYKARKGHKLDEWRDFRNWVETLPYSELITQPKKTKEK